MRQVVITAAVLLAGVAWAQDTAVFRAGVELVHVDAEVTQNGRTLPGLRKSDFLIRDNGAPYEVTLLSEGQDALDLVLLFDISGSMKRHVKRVAGAARDAMAEMREGDRVCVMVFNTKSRVVVPFTTNLGSLADAIATEVVDRPFGGGTKLQASVDDAAVLLRTEPKTNRRRAVLIVTDDIGSRSRPERVVLRDFWEADAVLSGIIMPLRIPLLPAFALRKITEASVLARMKAGSIVPIVDKTGGDAMTDGEAGSSLPEMVRRIRSRYSLYYALPKAKAGSVRTVEVELTPERLAEFPGAVVRARNGYIMPEARK